MELSEMARKAVEAELGSVPPLPLPLVGREKMKLAVARQVFARDFSDREELAEFMEGDERFEKANAINRVLVELTGFGPDLLTIHHLSHPDMEPSAETTILDLDMACYREAAGAIAKAKGRELEPYSESLYAFLTQRRDGNEMVYGVLYAAGPYLWSALEEILFDWVDRHYPVSPGPIDSAEAAMADIRRRMENPSPSEKLHYEILSKGSQLITDMVLTEGATKTFDSDEAWVYHASENLGYETKEYIIFSNRKAMEKVRLGHFKEDLDALPRAGDQLDRRLKSISAEFEIRLEVLAKGIENGFAATVDDSGREDAE